MKNVNTNKKTDVKDAMNEIKVIGKPIDLSDFWFYTEEITDEEGNPTVFHVQEGAGDNLSEEDVEEGFTDYIYYDTFDGKITYRMIDAYGFGDDADTLAYMESDGGMVLLYNPYRDLTLQQICWKVLNLSGTPNPEGLTVRILSGKWADEKFLARGKEKEANSSGHPTERNLLIAIWVKNKGDYQAIGQYLANKTWMSSKEEESLLAMEQKAVSEIGGRIVTCFDEDYLDSYRKMKCPPFCYIEKGSLRFDTPIIPMK